MRYPAPPDSALPDFDQLPTLSDECIADTLNLLMAMVDAYENHYADPLSRWREKRYREMQEDAERDQLTLPWHHQIDDPF